MKKIMYLLMLVSVSTFAQKSINNYKYIIVPKQFDFVKSPDKYQTSSLTKFLFNKHNFKAFLSDETLPNDVLKNPCLVLTAEVKDKSGMLSTKNVIELRDCNNRVVYTSVEGRSKLKEYKKAYHEAIRRAFKSIEGLNYKYTSNTVEVIKDTEKVEKITTPSKPKEKEIVAIQQQKKVSVVTPKQVEVKKASKILYAQPKQNGYQLVNTKPAVVFELLNTNVKDVFIIKNKNGILYKNKSSWIAEYYENGNKITKKYEVKF